MNQMQMKCKTMAKLYRQQEVSAKKPNKFFKAIYQAVDNWR
jgi:hypothetical protein